MGLGNVTDAQEEQRRRFDDAVHLDVLVTWPVRAAEHKTGDPPVADREPAGTLIRRAGCTYFSVALLFAVADFPCVGLKVAVSVTFNAPL